MDSTSTFPQSVSILAAGNLGELFAVLQQQGYRVIGPTVRQEAIVYDRIDSPEDLPVGWTQQTSPGTYRLQPRNDRAYFGYQVGPHSWKKYLFPPRLKLWSARRDAEGGFEIEAADHDQAPLAFFGVRPCELKAIEVQDRVFQGSYTDPVYAQRREQAMIIAVSCVEAGETCFCDSMDAGPDAATGFDLALTELLDDERHDFLLRVGSPRGAELAAELPMTPARPRDLEAAAAGIQHARQQMGRHLNRVGLHDLLQDHRDPTRWEAVANRCLSCGNCTLVCPTCFCHTVEDSTSLDGSEADRTRVWDSCFHLNFSYLGGGQIRKTTRSRYRQWITHKLSTWEDQFGVSGCVGCGRCITWCPVGIDLTAEVEALQSTPSPQESA
jgi:ferredoxin